MPLHVNSLFEQSLHFSRSPATHCAHAKPRRCFNVNASPLTVQLHVRRHGAGVIAAAGLALKCQAALASGAGAAPACPARSCLPPSGTAAAIPGRTRRAPAQARAVATMVSAARLVLSCMSRHDAGHGIAQRVHQAFIVYRAAAAQRVIIRHTGTLQHFFWQAMAVGRALRCHAGAAVRRACASQRYGAHPT